MSLEQTDTRRKLHVTTMRAFLMIACAFSIIISACSKNQSNSGDKSGANESAASNTQTSTGNAAQIIERYRALDNSSDSVMKLRATITGAGEKANAPSQVELTIYRKRKPDGTRMMFIEFTSPAQERDRDALVTIGPQGEVEGVRYAQSADEFISSKNVEDEESLFGLTLQELADGQPEKYDFTLIGEETFNSSPVYRLEGKLKLGEESKFPRLVLLISKDNFAALAAEFYDNKNELARNMTVTEMKQVEGHWTRMRWTIDNRARQMKIDFAATEAKYDQNLPDSIFTREHLKQAATK
ncbi:MAG TPA: outer membrane lipoprotein-sorting protein [Blastocatellia bacterium]|nr:outer membrane lipoprotein-sorting protein [Blastocatellia bacterium]